MLVGPNGAGKTNLLKVIQFLGDTARLDLEPAIERHGGFDNLRFRGKSSVKSIKLSVEAIVTPHASAKAIDEYTLSFRQQKATSGLAWTQRIEEFVFKRTKGRGRRISVQGGEVRISSTESPTGRNKRELSKRELSMSKQSAGLSTLQRLGDDEGAPQVQALASLFETFRVFEVDVIAAKTPCADASANMLAQDASNLAAFLGYLQREHDEVFSAIESDLCRLAPNISGISVDVEKLGSTEGTVVYLSEHGLSGRTRLFDASFGTVRALALLAMLHDPNPPRLTCVEEIDHGLHPQALDVIVERLRSASERTQLLVATHSPALVNRLHPDELIVCQRHSTSGESIIPAIDPMDVAEMVEASGLLPGELWFSGALGG